MSNFLAAVKATHKPPMPHQQAAWNFAWDQLDEKQKAELLKQLENIRKTYNLRDQDKMSMYFQA